MLRELLPSASGDQPRCTEMVQVEVTSPTFLRLKLGGQKQVVAINIIPRSRPTPPRYLETRSHYCRPTFLHIGAAPSQIHPETSRSPCHPCNSLVVRSIG